MTYQNLKTRLRLIPCTLCMVIAALVLLWGSAFKASLYHTCNSLAHIPAAKLLTEHERPSQAESAHIFQDGIASAPRATPPMPAIAIGSPQFALSPLATLPLPATSVPLEQNPALGFYFHHPPPLI